MHQMKLGCGVQIPILARVQALEAGVPGQQERLSMHLDGKGGPAPLAGQQAPLMTRVEALERAMAALLKAQVHALCSTCIHCLA